MCDIDQTCEGMSSQDSCNTMWKSIKIDIDQSRASQEEQLQNLKGRLLKQHTRNSKQRRRSKGIKKKKRQSKTGVYKKALEMITSALVAKKVKSRRRLFSPRIKEMSAMKFDIIEKLPSPTDCDNLQPESPCRETQQPTVKSTQDKGCEPMLRDQSVQAEVCPPLLIKDICASCQECSHVFVNRCACKTILLDGVSLPLFAKPVTYGMNIETLNSFCSHREKCTGSSPPEAANHQPTAKVITDQGIQTDNQTTISEQSPWKQLCQDLILRLCPPNSIPVTRSVDPVCQELQKLNETLQNFQSNLRTKSSNPVVTSFGASSHNSAFVSAAASSVVLQSNASSEPSPSTVTPDLLAIHNHCSDVDRLTYSSKENHQAPVVSEKSAVKAPQHELIVQKEGHINEQDLIKPAMETDMAESKIADGRNFTDQEEQNNHSMSSEIDSEVANITKTAVVNVEKCKEKTGETSEKQCVTVNSIKRHLFNSNSEKKKQVVLEIDTNSSQEKSSHQHKAAVDGKADDKSDTRPRIERNKALALIQEAKSFFTNSPQEKSSQQNKIGGDGEAAFKADSRPGIERDIALAMIQEANSLNAKCEEISDSPAFEEMDASELENLLLVWRQQEQLHQDQGKRFSASSSRASSPNYLFRKLKRPRELPLELQNVKVLQPPPLQKALSSDTSALSILEKEAHESPTMEEDEDIPEIQLPNILQPRKRRLRLQPAPKFPLKNNSPPAPPLPVVFQKINEPPEFSTSSKSDANVHTNDKDEVQNLAVTSSKSCPGIDDKEENESEKTPIVEKNAPKPRASKRLKASVSSEKGKRDASPGVNERQESKSEICRKGSKRVAKPPAEKKQAIKSKIKKKNEKASIATQDLKGALNRNESSEKKDDFKDQIKERVAKIQQNWLHEKSLNDCGDINASDLHSSSKQMRSPSPSESIICNPGVLISEDELKLFKEVPAFEVGKCHDLAVHVLLNPWRGISAKLTSKGFVCPAYDTKSVTRALWDLRSNAAPENIAERILAILGSGWKDVHPIAYKAMVSMFVVALARHVPFVIEDANCAEEDDTSSIVSDVDQNSKKKYTPLRLMASEPIFKGECIDGLRGLIIKVTPQEKDRLKSWNLPKFKQGRNWAIFGPIAYLKRKETNFNTEIVLLSENLIAAKATRNILRGEKLLVSFDGLEK